MHITTPSLFKSTPLAEELKSCMTGFPYLARPQRPQCSFVLSQFSCPVLLPQLSYFSVENIICFSHYQRLWVNLRHLWVLQFSFHFCNIWGGVVAFNEWLLNFHIFWECDCVFKFVPELCSWKTLKTMLHSLAIPELFFPLPSPTFRGSDSSPKHWVQSNKEREMEKGFWI